MDSVIQRCLVPQHVETHTNLHLWKHSLNLTIFSRSHHISLQRKSARNFLHSNAGAVMWPVRFAVNTIANSVLTVVSVVTGASTISRSYQVRFLRILKCHYASGSSPCISLTIFFSSDSLSRIVFFFLISNLKFLYW